MMEEHLAVAARASLELHEALDAMRIILTSTRGGASMDDLEAGEGSTAEAEDGTEGPLGLDPPLHGVTR